MKDNTKDWDVIIKSDRKLWHFGFSELWRYRDLVFLFVRRDFVANYKQTVLGPLWHIIQPLLTTLTFTIIFGNIAGLSTDGSPKILFYLSGIIAWSYFSLGLTKTSTTFISNAHIFSKVYFPRLSVPISIVISNLISFGIQLLTFFGFLLYFILVENYSFNGNITIIFLPLLLILMAFLALGAGILVSSLTTKYRDISFLVGFGVQLMMYFSPVIFPLDTVEGKLKYLLLANPMTPIIEAFRYSLLGTGEFNWLHLSYSLVITLIMVLGGVIIFNKVERSFNDTV
ncbi:MAG: ABC transporter permease [Flavobacteriales bacterium]|nr:ABC transporter permease [Flavobacteriales bacterium]